jgi:hypothetical protein
MEPGTHQQCESYPSRSLPTEPTIVAYHRRVLAVLANPWREPTVRAYYHRELRDLKLVASMVGRLYLGKTKLSGSTRRKTKS